MSFDDLGLSEEVLRAVGDAGYTDPTPIQAKAVPYVLMGRDILGCAQTGTGKTASFTLPMIDILAAGRARARMPRTLILEPTRELAAQVAENFDTYGKYNKLSKALIIGGQSMDDQYKLIDRGVDVLIATPGRLIDLFDRGMLLLNDVKILVIDEADRMLDMGFIPDVERIVGLLPKMRQTLFFSATMPPEIRRLADAFLMNPKEITVAPPATPAEKIFQGIVPVTQKERGRGGGYRKFKREALRTLLEKEEVRSALIFCNRKRDVDILCRSLRKHGFDAAALHGDMAQSARTETLEKFKADEIRLVVCSDVAARGIDINDLSHVFNFDIPTHAEDYVHRIGRTGRAGREGRAFTLVTPEDDKYLHAIERLQGRKIEENDVGLGKPGRAERTKQDDDKPEKSSSRRRSGKPIRDDKQDGKQDDAEPEKSSSRRRSGKPKRDNKQDDRQDGRRNEKRGKEPDRAGKDEAVVGMGDHVPAFMLRPAKAPS